ncbi:MAG: RIO1 family regulatory kinase/ATPase [Rhodoglobus sp.]
MTPRFEVPASYELSFSVPTFGNVEPDVDQRWSTWPSILPSQRGPEPRPAWVVTSAGAIDTELGIVKTGKEADVFLIERADPAHPEQAAVMAAKRYRSADRRDFHRSSQYEEGRRTRRSRDARAISNKSSYGRSIAADHWAFAEFDALCRMREIGAPVPYPVQVNGTELLMEFIGNDGVAAPRLAQVRDGLHDLFEQVVHAMRLFARGGFAHGDLSPYNLLVHDGRIVVIDLPQIVDAVSNPNGLDLLHRDCTNIADWFTRQRVEVDAEELFAEMLGELF